jgi:hypothetical protein
MNLFKRPSCKQALQKPTLKYKNVKLMYSNSREDKIKQCWLLEKQTPTYINSKNCRIHDNIIINCDKLNIDKWNRRRNNLSSVAQFVTSDTTNSRDNLYLCSAARKPRASNVSLQRCLTLILINQLKQPKRSLATSNVVYAKEISIALLNSKNNVQSKSTSISSTCLMNTKKFFQ